MSSLEGTFPSLLQGVSQQVPRLRLDGQVAAQENMLSDPVTGIRRRPGTPVRVVHNFGDLTDTNLFTQYIERGADGRNLVINTQFGNWWVLSNDAVNVLASGVDEYLKTSAGLSSIQTTSVGGETFILNIEQFPEAVASTTKIDPDTTGWYYTKTGAFSKEFNLTVSRGGETTTVSYTTPNSTDEPVNGETPVQRSTPQYITTQLANKLKEAGIEVFQQDMYLAIRGSAPVQVTSTSGSAYVGQSNRHNVNLVADLSPVIPGLDGLLTSVGTDANALTWYRWDAASRSWKEDSAYGSPAGIRNMPRILGADDQITSRDFEGRLSGDDLTNEPPSFLDQGIITGMTTYQGRLVLLSGPFVSMSKSGNPYRFFRSTVTELLPGDRIDVGIGSSQNSVLRRGIQFNRDLVLFGDSIQAVISSGGGVLTPSNAAISITSEQSCISRINPMASGQTVLYPFKRSAGYFGLLELIPSQYSSSQYISQDSTGHLPEYMQGETRYTTSSNVVNMCVCSGSSSKDLYVYEYQWSSEGKQQAAWHRWTFPVPVHSVHFARESLVLFMSTGSGACYITVIDAREGYDKQHQYLQPYVDMQFDVKVQARQATIPSQMLPLFSTGSDPVLVFADGEMATEEAGIESINGSTLTTVRGVPDGNYKLGLRIRSLFSPTAPLLKDENGKEIGTGKVRLLRQQVSVRNTGSFDVRVQDIRTDVDVTADYTGVFLNSPELMPNYPLIISQANIIVPCRTLADTTEVSYICSGTHDMNILDISYILRYNERHRRV